jgi:5-methylcytosine-specific restriction endonuclease McrA
VCHICGQSGADSVDHVIPLARGGTDARSNLRPVHHNVWPKCNRQKGDRDYAPIIRRSGALS